MFYAIYNGTRITAIPNIKDAICPLCNEAVIPKCGSIKIWHWCHKSNTECDSFGEPETEWHLNWKNNFPKENQEIIIIKGLFDKKHRADIKIKDLVIELQNSPISSIDIEERESFYGNMIWIINQNSLFSGFIIKKDKGNGILTFRWKHPAKSWFVSKKPIYLDMGAEYLFKIIKLYPSKPFEAPVSGSSPCAGYGRLIKKEELIGDILGNK